MSNGTSEVRFAFVGMMTAQVFDAPGRYGWQRAEVDVSQWIAPSATMTMKFVNYCGFPVSEFGIDNVRIDRATTCARSGLRIKSATVDDAAPGWGNANGVLEPGETARVQVRLANDGTAPAFSPVATLRDEAEGALVHESTASFPDIAPAATGDSLAPHFTVTAPGRVSCNDTLALEFEVVTSWSVVSGRSNSVSFPLTTAAIAGGRPASATLRTLPIVVPGGASKIGRRAGGPGLLYAAGRGGSSTEVWGARLVLGIIPRWARASLPSAR